MEISSCDSTNDELKKMADSGAPHGAWLSALRQIKGRGRNQRRWESLEGNLFVSILLRPQKGFHAWTWIPLMTAVALVDVLKREFPDLQCQIKWPNDLYVEGKKLGGILCEGSSSANGAYVVVGIGLNCMSRPDNPEFSSVSLAELVDYKDEIRPRLRDSVTRKLVQFFEQLQNEGPLSIQENYWNYALFKEGVSIYWKNLRDQRQGNGFVESLGVNGELMVRTADGKKICLMDEEISVRESKGSF